MDFFGGPFFWLPFARLHGIFLARRQDRDCMEFRGFPGMELGIVRVAKSSGEGRASGGCLRMTQVRVLSRSTRLSATINVSISW